MLQVLTLLWTVSLILLIVGIFKPSSLTFLKLPRTRSKVFKVVGVPCLIVFVTIGILVPKRIESVKKQAIISQDERTDPLQVPVKKSTEVYQSTIPGLMPSDIYLSFEKIGFKTEKEIHADGSFFISTLQNTGITYEVKVYCEAGISTINTIRLSATRILPEYNTLDDVKEFVKYGCSLPYDGSNKEQINAFLDKKFNSDKASIVISGVRFTIFAPTKFYRLIQIESE